MRVSVRLVRGGEVNAAVFDLKSLDVVRLIEHNADKEISMKNEE